MRSVIATRPAATLRDHGVSFVIVEPDGISGRYQHPANRTPQTPTYLLSRQAPGENGAKLGLDSLQLKSWGPDRGQRRATACVVLRASFSALPDRRSGMEGSEGEPELHGMDSDGELLPGQRAGTRPASDVPRRAGFGVAECARPH